MDKRERLNLIWIVKGQLNDAEIPEDEKNKLEGLERVETWKPNALKYGLLPASILFGFSTYIMVLSKVWIGIPIAFVACLIFYIVLLFNSPTHCPRCRREMDYYRPHTPGIKYDWCKRCKCYSNVRWVPEGAD